MDRKYGIIFEAGEGAEERRKGRMGGAASELLLLRTLLPWSRLMCHDCHCRNGM